MFHRVHIACTPHAHRFLRRGGRQRRFSPSCTTAAAASRYGAAQGESTGRAAPGESTCREAQGESTGRAQYEARILLMGTPVCAVSPPHAQPLSQPHSPSHSHPHPSAHTPTLSCARRSPSRGWWRGAGLPRRGSTSRYWRGRHRRGRYRRGRTAGDTGVVPTRPSPPRGRRRRARPSVTAWRCCGCPTLLRHSTWRRRLPRRCATHPRMHPHAFIYVCSLCFCMFVCLLLRMPYSAATFNLAAAAASTVRHAYIHIQM